MFLLFLLVMFLLSYVLVALGWPENGWYIHLVVALTITGLVGIWLRGLARYDGVISIFWPTSNS